MRVTVRAFRAVLGLALGLLALPAGAEPAKPDQLVMREWEGPWGDAMEHTAARIFTERTGIPIVMDHRLDPAMSTLVQTALAQHRQPPVDIFYTLDPTAHKDQLRGLMDDLDPAIVTHLPDMLPLAKPASKNGGWPYVNVGVDIMTLVYRKDKFPGGAPDSLNVMFDPAFKGRTLIYKTSEGNLAMVALANHWTMPADLDKIWSFIAAKMKPMDPILGGDPEAVGGFQRNEIDLAFTYSAIPKNLGNDSGIGWTRAKEGMFGIYEGAWVPRGLPDSNRYWAMRFIDMLISPDVLTTYCTELLIPCFRKDMAVPAAERNDPAFPKTPEELAALFTTPLDEYAAHQPEWDAHFDEIMK